MAATTLFLLTALLALDGEPGPQPKADNALENASANQVRARDATLRHQLYFELPGINFMYSLYEFEEVEASFTNSYKTFSAFYEAFLLHPHWVFASGLGVDAGLGLQYASEKSISATAFVAEAGLSYEHRLTELLGAGARIGTRFELGDDGFDDEMATTWHPTLAGFADVFLFDWLSVRPALVLGYRLMKHAAVEVKGLTLGAEIGLCLWAL